MSKKQFKKEQKFEVETIIAEDKEKKKFLVKWKNYDNRSNSWVPIENMENCSEAIEKFRKIQAQIKEPQLACKQARKREWRIVESEENDNELVQEEIVSVASHNMDAGPSTSNTTPRMKFNWACDNPAKLLAKKVESDDNLLMDESNDGNLVLEEKEDTINPADESNTDGSGK